MARTETTVELTRSRKRFLWPEQFLSFWLLIIIACGITQIVVYSLFIQQQNQIGAGTPWLFPYAICVGALTLALVVFINIQSNNGSLVPETMFLVSVMFFALYLTGLIETSIQLFGSGSNVNSNCRTYIMGQQYSGKSPYTLAWLEQNSICQSWYASFAFWIVGVIFFIWLFIMTIVVQQNQVDETRVFGEDD